MNLRTVDLLLWLCIIEPLSKLGHLPSTSCAVSTRARQSLGLRVVQGVLKGNEGLARVGKGPRRVSTLFGHLEMFSKGASKGRQGLARVGKGTLGCRPLTLLD